MLVIGTCLIAIISIYYMIRITSDDKTLIEVGIYSGNEWGVPQIDIYEIYEEAIRRFERENEDVKVIFRSGTLMEDYSEWLAQKILKGKEPDVFIVLDEDFNTLSEIGMLEALNPYIDKASQFSLNDYYDKALEAGNSYGLQYAMPFQIVPTFMIVNKTLLDKNKILLPQEEWSLESFLEISKQLTIDTDGDGIIDQYGSVGYEWDYAYYAANGNFEKGSKAIDIYDEVKLAGAIDFARSLHQLNQGHNVNNNDFEEGRVGFKPFSFAEFRAYRSYPFRVKKYSDFEWEAVPFPVSESDQSQAKLYTVQIGMSSRSSEKDLSWKFIEYLSSNDDIQQMVWDTTYALPAKISVVDHIYSNQDISDNILDPTFLKNMIEESVIEPTFKEYNQIRQAMEIQIKLNILEGKSTQETIRAVRKDVDHILFNIE